ncbi:hypothetical protein BDP81DRAFT_412150 [Colletotrichum phormii]|uniref:Secreted protein n=1 Tax=Colletotrichum phormii TaxID=359342 RepID=A0AAJ0EKG4_9PEZI|nr:uncharacterized protein BDP81DRAFT_412150 [Colletotrichum phormii]KAK1655171.1 hypothetical protein BDP81DRAFT_412150 [Colletotrichum phormii]
MVRPAVTCGLVAFLQLCGFALLSPHPPAHPLSFLVCQVVMPDGRPRDRLASLGFFSASWLSWPAHHNPILPEPLHTSFTRLSELARMHSRRVDSVE